MEKICIACGMPMKSKEDFAAGDQMKDYCRYCARPDGTMKSYDEVLAGSLAFCMQGDNYKACKFKTRPTESEAREGIKQYMATLPAWKK